MSHLLTDRKAPSSAATISAYGIAIAVVGTLIQLLLGSYYLYMGHAPSPHHLPVGVVAQTAQREQLTSQLEADGQFSVHAYRTAGDLRAAVKSREATAESSSLAMRRRSTSPPPPPQLWPTCSRSPSRAPTSSNSPRT